MDLVDAIRAEYSWQLESARWFGERGDVASCKACVQIADALYRILRRVDDNAYLPGEAAPVLHGGGAQAPPGGTGLRTPR